MKNPKEVFNTILEQIGGEENLLAVGVEPNSIIPAACFDPDVSEHEQPGLCFSLGFNEVGIFLDNYGTHTVYVNGKKTSSQVPFYYLCFEVEKALGKRLPYYILAELSEQRQGNKVAIKTTYRRIRNPFVQG